MTTEVDAVKAKKIVLGCLLGFIVMTTTLAALGFYLINESRQRQIESGTATTMSRPGE